MPWRSWTVAASACALLLGLLGCRGGDASDKGEASEEGHGLDDADLAALEALGYANFVTPGSDAVGVTIHRREMAFQGLNLLSRWSQRDAVLMDMDGVVVHRWVAPGDAAWNHVEVLPGGELLALDKRSHVEKLTWDGQPIWKVPLRAHHDMDVADDGRVLVLVKGNVPVDCQGVTAMLRVDGVAVISPEGALERTVWLQDLLEGHVPQEVFQQALALRPMPKSEREERQRDRRRQALLPGAGNVLHANTLEMLDHDIPGLGRRGQVLLSMRNTSEIAVFDLDRGEATWKLSGDFAWQHQPSLLPNDHILMFDNGVSARKASRVIEIDGRTKSIVWQYPNDPLGRERFFSRTRGGCQLLPNGNVLITVSDEAMSMEVTRNGEIVWAWHNPESRDGKRAAVYRLERLPREYFPELQ